MTDDERREQEALGMTIGAVYRVRNASTLPVYGVSIIWRTPDDSIVSDDGFENVVPGRTIMLRMPTVPDAARPEVIFTDAANRRWHRRRDGSLLEVDRGTLLVDRSLALG